MTISSSTITSNREYGSAGQRKIIESHIDIIGRTHRKTYIVSSSDNLSALLASHANTLALSLINAEQQRYISDVEAGLNPFEVTPSFTDINVMRAIALNYFLSSNQPTSLIKAVPLLALVTDIELQSLLSIDQTKVDEIRQKAIDVSSIGSKINDYTAPLGEL